MGRSFARLAATAFDGMQETRRVWALLCAVCVHAVIIWAVFAYSPQTPQESPLNGPEIISVTFVTPTRGVEASTIPVQPVGVNQAPVAPSQSLNEVSGRVVADAAELTSLPEIDPPVVEIDTAPVSHDQPIDAAGLEVDFTTPPSSATQQTLRGLLCRSEAYEATNSQQCRSGLAEARWRAEEYGPDMAHVQSRTDELFISLASLFGAPSSREPPSFQAGGRNAVLGVSSMSLPASDSMRDRLPPSMPDPAFGD